MFSCLSPLAEDLLVGAKGWHASDSELGSKVYGNALG